MSCIRDLIMPNLFQIGVYDINRKSGLTFGASCRVLIEIPKSRLFSIQ